MKVYLNCDSLCDIFMKQNGENKQTWSVLEVLYVTKNVPLFGVLDGKHYIHISLETVHKQRLKSRYFKYFENSNFHCWYWSDEKTLNFGWCYVMWCD